MNFNNVPWSGSLRCSEFGLLCDCCGKSLGHHIGLSCPAEKPQNRACGPKIIGVDWAEDETPDQFPNFAWLEFMKLAAPDVAAVDDTSLPPRQRRIANAKEEAVAAKQQLKHDAEAKALQERADQLADAGKAMDRVNQSHDHRLGWMQ